MGRVQVGVLEGWSGQLQPVSAFRGLGKPKARSHHCPRHRTHVEKRVCRGTARSGLSQTFRDTRNKWKLSCQRSSVLVIDSFMVLQFGGRQIMNVWWHWLATKLHACRPEPSLGSTAGRGAWQDLNDNLVNKVMKWPLDDFLASSGLVLMSPPLPLASFFFL